MKTISVAELRQNPTNALDSAAKGEIYVITKHRQPLAQLGPLSDVTLPVVPARNPGPVTFEDWPTAPVTTQETIDELVDWAKGDR